MITKLSLRTSENVQNLTKISQRDMKNEQYE